MSRVILGVVLFAAAVGNCEASALEHHQHQDVQHVNGRGRLRNLTDGVDCTGYDRSGYRRQSVTRALFGGHGFYNEACDETSELRRLQDSTCSNGFTGIDSDNGKYCCSIDCTACGGSGCGGFGPLCCIGDIEALGSVCSVTGEAPCFMDGATDTAGGTTTTDPTTTGPTTTGPTTTTTTTTTATDGDDLVTGSTCSNGLIPGVESDNGKYCCPSGCTGCAGSGCGSFGTGCCSSDIDAAGTLCSDSLAAPCLITGATDTAGGTTTTDPTTTGPTTTGPTTTTTTTTTATDGDDLVTGSTCSNGLIPGVESDNGKYCCPSGCTGCAGSGCGSFGTGCCSSDIEAGGTLCSDSLAAPCLITGETTDISGTTDFTTETSPTTDGTTCSNGFVGIESSNGMYCCSTDCTACGGSGCGSFGPTCCAGSIAASGRVCSETGEAPCFIDDGEQATCSNGLTGVESSSGDYCCASTCSSCGGSGCGSFGPNCCVGNIAASGRICSETGEAPCFIDDASAPAPTPSGPAPTTPPAPEPTPEPQPQPQPNPVPSPPTISPTPVMTIPSSCNDPLPSIRFAGSSGLAGRLYMEGSGCGTMTDLYQTQVEDDGWTPKGPIYILDENNDIDYAPTAFTGKWLLTVELFVEEGSIFYCRGTDIGGDCDELRIESTGSDNYHEIRGHGGSLYFENTIVTSWDTPNKQPQEEYEGGRSFLRCLSEVESDVTCDGEPKNDLGECRMDILNSEIAYMGYNAAESYGLSWKVRGFCKDLSNPEVFENTNVYGDIINSDIHHLYYGMYSYGHQGGVWTDNKMHDNVVYGFDPHDDSDYLIIARNEVYNNNNHGIIASKRCNNVEIYDNEVYGGGEEAVGIFLHRSGDFSSVYNNYVHDMQDAGVALLESSDCEIYDNTLIDLKFGIRISVGGSRNDVYNNFIDTCSDYGLYTYEGSDVPDFSVGRPTDNIFRNNEILNTIDGIKLSYSDDTEIYDNTFGSGTEELTFTDSDGISWYDNTVPADTCVRLEGENAFARSEGLPAEEC